MKKMFLVFAIARLVAVLYGQPLTKINDMTFGGVNSDRAIFTFLDTFGNCYVFGNITLSSPPADITEQFGGSDYSAVRYDKNGNKVWSNSYGGSEDDILYKVIPNSTGFLLIGISFSGNNGNKTSTASCINPYPGSLINSSRSVWLVQIDFLGNILSQNQVCTDVAFGSTYSRAQVEEITDFKQLSNKEYILFGNFTSFSGPIGTNFLINNFIGYMRLDTSYNYIKAVPVLGSPVQTAVPAQYVTYTEVYNGIAGEVLELPNGNLIFSYTSEQTYNRAGCGDNSTNVFSYARTSLYSMLDVPMGNQGYGSDYGYSAARKMIYYNNSVYLFMQHIPLPVNTVNYYGTCAPLPFYIRTAPARTNTGKMDCWIVKLSTAMVPEADYAFGANDDVTVDDVITDGTNLILGTTVNSGIGFDKTSPGKGGEDYWILNIDPITMTSNSDYCYGGSNDDLLSRIGLMNDVFLLTGSSYSDAGFDKSANNLSGSTATTDQWTVVLCQTPAPPVIQEAGSFNLLLCCKNSPATVNISNPVPGYSYNWYISATGPSVYTGNSYTTPSNILISTSLFVDQNNGYCGSSRTGFSLYPIPTPKPPSISPDTIVCKGKTLRVIAQTDTLGIGTFPGYTRWYDSTGTHLIHTGDTLEMKNFTDNKTFYVSTIDSVYVPASNFGPLVCESAEERIQTSVDTAQTPAMTMPPYYCYGTSATLSLTNELSGNTVGWIHGINLPIPGNSFTINNLISNDSVLVVQVDKYGCESPWRKFILNVAKDSALAPIIPVKSMYCYGTSPVFSVTNGAGNVIKWYDTQNMLVYTGNKFTLPNIHLTDTISLFQIQPSGCTSLENTYIFKVAGDSSQMPQSDLKAGYCRGDNVVLTVSYPLNAGINWYNSSGKLIYSGNPFVQNNILVNDTIYTSSVGTNGCVSPLEKLIVAATMPTSAFSATDTTMSPGDATHFLNTSTAGITFNWSFGDNSVSASVDPWHFYNSPGVYTIQLITTDANGCTDTLTKHSYIHVGAFMSINELITATGFRIYPNPFKDQLTIENKTGGEPCTICLTDVLGQVIDLEIVYGSRSISTDGLPAGIYFIQIKKGQAIRTVKLLKADK